MTADFHESMHEVEPLYASLKQDSSLARGVARALERIGKEGIKSLNLQAELAISIPGGSARGCSTTRTSKPICTMSVATSRKSPR